MTFMCLDCKLSFTGDEDREQHKQENPTHFISGSVTVAEPITGDILAEQEHIDYALDRAKIKLFED